MQQNISDYLRSPDNNRRPHGKQNRDFAYLLTYIGELFVQGYRLVQNYGSILLFSLMEFQFSDNPTSKTERKQAGIPPRFKILLWEMNTSNIFQNAKSRREKFNQMVMIGSMLDQVQYHIIYLRQFRYSIVDRETLQKNGLSLCLLYFKKIQWMDCQNGQIPIGYIQQGKQLHDLIELFVKGAGEARNREKVRTIKGNHKFNYNLFRTINTVCYIVGKQMLQNDLQSLTSEKWIRKYTQKNFRRYDLLMRNEEKSLIIDWKFSTQDAIQKATSRKNKKKNQIYCQLARKDFKNSVELRFYCFSTAIQNSFYHQITFANFEEQISTIQLETKMRTDYSEISISDSESEEALVNELANKTPLDVIQVMSSEQVQILEIMDEQVQEVMPNNNLKHMENPQKFIRAFKINQNQNINPEEIQVSQKTSKKSKKRISKQQIKNEKRIYKNVLTFPVQIVEIQSD